MRKCVVIGCGWGTQHIEAILEHPGAVLAGVCDINEERLSGVAQKYGVKGFQSVEQLKEVDFDTAMLCTQPTLHKEQCIGLMELGKSILCEKPLGRTLCEVEEIASAANKYGTHLGVIFNQRHCFATQKAKELLDAADSRLHMITACMHQAFSRKIEGHIEEDILLTDACCHLLDLMTWFGGDVKSVYALKCKVESEVFSDVLATVEFKNGGIGSMSHTIAGGLHNWQHPTMHINIHTDKFRLVIENFNDRLRVYPHDEYGQLIYEPNVFVRHDYATSLYKAVGDFIDALNRGEKPPVDINDALRNIKIIEAFKESSRSGNSVRLDNIDFSYGARA